jgi:quercetin dioxygenase-like cupin family protein
LSFTMTWLMDDSVVPGAGLSLARMVVEPANTTEAHRHPNCNEVIHAVSGVIEVIIDNVPKRLQPGETILIPCGAVHQLRNAGPNTAEVMIAYSAGTRIYEKAS